jgi:hypothetical protein
MNSKPFWEWVNERHAIYIRKSIREGVDPGLLHVPQGADLEECDPEHFAMRPEGLLTSDPALAAYSLTLLRALSVPKVMPPVRAKASI